MHRWRFRCTVKHMLAAMAVVAIAVALGLATLYRPYCLTGTYENGNRAWEQWERYSWSLRPTHIRTVRYYRNGQIGMISEGGDKIYRDLEGNKTDVAVFYKLLQEEGGEVERDLDSRRPLGFLLGD